MKTFKMGMLCLLIAAIQPCLLGQLTADTSLPKCTDSHRVVAPKSPARTSVGNILVGQSIMQAQFALGKNATVQVMEHPRSGKYVDAYNSTIVVRSGQKQEEYPVENLIKGGEFLRLVEIASLCSSPSSGSVFLAFETASTGAKEGFAVIRYSPKAIEVRALPLADQGRIVVRSATEVELWTAVGAEDPGGIECDGCKKRYATENCHLGQQGIRCSKPTKTVRGVSPGSFMRARIEVR